MTHVAADLESDLGWALGVVLRGYAKAAQQVIADVPGGPRGYQVLTAAVTCIAGTQLKLAHQLGIDRTVMTYLLDDLERAGLIERQPDPSDRRARRIVATDSGRAALFDLTDRLEHAEAVVLGALDEADRTQFRALLRKVAVRVDAQDPAGDPCGVVEQMSGVEPAARVRRRSR